MIVVRWLRAFADFWIGFVVGDDWTVAATVLVALVATWGLVSAGIPAWWSLPVAAVGSTVVSLRRAARRAP
jgi:uncharacterized membrane protein